MTQNAYCKRCGKSQGEVAVLIPYRGEHLCDTCVEKMNRKVLEEFARDEEIRPLEGDEAEESAETFEDDDDEDIESEDDLTAWSPLKPFDEESIGRMIERITDGETIERKDLSKEPIDPGAVALLPKAVAEQFCLIPIRKESKKLLVAFSDPDDEEALYEVKYFTGMEVNVVAADQEDIEAAIEKYYES